jgi:flagellar motility protein MotE (MotC chaperone)
MPVILAVAERMREAKMAAILAAMDPARARVVTSELARHRELPQLN